MSLIQYSRKFFFVLFLVNLMSCGNLSQVQNPTGGDTSCKPNSAEIAVGDGYVETLCGCQEAGGVVFGAGNSLTCTVPKGTMVFFMYLGTQLWHQIVPAVPDAFPASPLSDPKSTIRIFVHAVLFSNTGNFGFTDNYNQNVKGTIVVQ